MAEDKSKTPMNPPTNPPAPPNEPEESHAEKAARVLESCVREAIKGLKFRTNKKIAIEGEPIRYVPDERPMQRADVLSAAQVGRQLVIVSADGRKHRIAG